MLSTQANAAEAGALARTILIAAWGGIALGLLMQLIALALHGSVLGTVPPSVARVADTVQKVSWNTLICVALAFGATASRNSAVVTGLVGLLAAPAAFFVARAARSAVHGGLQTAATVDLSPWMLAGLRGIEYACLGLLLAWASKRMLGLVSHGLVGLIVGVGTAMTIIVMMIAFLPQLPPAASLTLRAVQEVGQPLGCAMVIYAGNALSTRLQQQSGTTAQ